MTVWTVDIGIITPSDLSLRPSRTFTVPEVVTYLSEKYGISPELPLNIAWCESRFIPHAKNASSTAEGIFQFIDGTWLNNCTDNLEDKLDAKKNIDCAVRMLSEGGEGHWTASKDCWIHKPYTRIHP